MKRWQDINKTYLSNDIEGLFVELNFRKSKWLLFGTYYLPSQNDQYNFDCFDKALDVCSSYEKVIVTGDFNAQKNGWVFDSFLYQHDLTNLVKVFTKTKEMQCALIYIWETAH